MRIKTVRSVRIALICLLMSFTFLFPVTPVYEYSVITASAAVAIQRPTSNLKDGSYLDTQKVILNCKTKGAVIYYTTNGKTPTNKSKKYKNPVKISSDCVLRAVAIKNGVKSKELICNYTIEDYSDITDDIIRYQTAIENNKVDRLSETDQEICTAVQKVISALITTDMTDYDKVKTIHDFIINTCAYDTSTEDPYDLPDSSFSIEGVIIKEVAVCQGYAETFKLFMNLLDVENQFVIGTADGISHAWNLVKIDGNWYHVDTTWDDPSSEDGEQLLRYDYFLVNDEQISENHIWERQNYPACTSKDLMYKVYEGCIIDSVNSYSEKFIELYNEGLRTITILYPENTKPNMDFYFDLPEKDSYYYSYPVKFGDYYSYTVFIR
jgi:hypothetical protein